MKQGGKAYSRFLRWIKLVHPYNFARTISGVYNINPGCNVSRLQKHEL